ncbi:MAG TPA: thrombospondin type 3 repeat-containing protein [Terriglobales bacterium]|nr:thrombospondin type 3 repeat-containing protein [Terriglobales bacterium]
MNLKKIAALSALALTLAMGLMIFGGSRTHAAGPVCTVGPSGDYTTIQAAVNDPGCGTINVAAGTYNELVSISRTVTLNGAQVGVDARTRAVPIANESVVGSPNGAFQILADNVVIDGFTIQGVNLDQTTNPGALGAGIWTNPGFSGTQGGHQIRNNIVQNNVIGIELDNTGTLPSRVERNLIQNNNELGADGGTGIDTNFGLVKAVIDSNKFVGHINSGIDTVQSAGSSITYSNNEFASNRRAIGLGVVTSSAITGNNIHDSNDLDTADIRIFGGASGLSISCNILANGLGRAIRINDAGFGFGPSSNISINKNNISGYPIGLEENLGGYTGGFNSLDATNNWWGSSTGPTIASNPGGTGELIIDEDGVVKYSPFLTSPSTCVPVVDLCPTDPNKTAPGQCGCGVPDTDTDGDGTADCHDLCPSDPNKIAPGVCGCGTPDTDTDHDGTPDCHDQCPNDPHKTAPGACGCGTPDTDTDHDGVPDCHDNCPTVPNPDQRDTNHDGIGDACTAFQFPSGGLFVVGDLVSLAGGSTVNFWGSQWAQNNPLTSGAAPSAFKGFEDGTTTPTCGGTWTSKPGNSSNPPGTIPQFMGVIVSSSIQKNGSAISGNVKKIIVIQTNPGYGPAPGKPGTGKVVAIVCGS